MKEVHIDTDRAKRVLNKIAIQCGGCMFSNCVSYCEEVKKIIEGNLRNG